MKYLVDECFRAEVEKHSWHAGRRGHLSRSWSRGGRGHELLHQFVWRLAGRALPEHPITIDHINRDPRDNRLENLRIASQTLQNLNTRDRHRPRHSLPRGVYYMPFSKKAGGKRRAKPYAAKVCHRGKQLYCGYFSTPQEAAEAAASRRTELMELEGQKLKETSHVG